MHFKNEIPSTVFSTALAPRVAARALRVALPALALLIGGCSTTPGTVPPSTPGVYVGPTVPPAVPGAPAQPGQPATPSTPATPLATEQRYFEEWFRGTPVVIATQPNSVLQLDVPLANSFDAGRAEIKPALAAVLERVAESLRRQVGARVTVAAPADPGGNAALAQQRAERVREHLVARRIAAPRIALAGGARAGTPLQLRMTIPPAAFPAVSRLQSPNIVPIKGVSPVATSRTGLGEKR